MRVDHALNGVRGGAGGGHVHHRVPAPTTDRPADRPTQVKEQFPQQRCSMQCL